MTVLEVRAARPYDVIVEPGASKALPSLLPDSATRVGIIVDAGLRDRAEALAAPLDRDVTIIEVPRGEEAKSVGVLNDCWNALAAGGFTRSDVVIGVGGGATTDLAGFVAATWLRGVDFISVPTTVLGMVDAAVGGKTGIDTPAGKNLVGAFHEPLGVLCDIDALATLPVEELRSGLAEVVKCGFIADPSILDDLAAAPEVANDPTHSMLPSLIEKGIAVKIGRVTGDLTERTTSTSAERVGREALNYGHTLGHAIERYRAYGIRHGEAISIGMVFAAELAQQAGLIDQALVERHRAALQQVGLPITFDAEAWGDLLTAMSLDKKTRGNQLRFVVLNELGNVQMLAGPEKTWLDEAYRRVSS